MTTSDYFVVTALDDQSDEAVLVAWQNGQVQGLDVLFQRYGTKVYSLAYKILADAEDAEAMTQEIFAALQRAERSQNPQETFYSFLMTLTRSRCLAQVEGRGWRNAIAKHLRGLFRQRKERSALPQSPRRHQNWQFDHTVPNPTISAEQLLSTLSRTERDILGLAYYEASNPKALAKRLQIPLQIVQHRSRKALVKLHDTRLTIV